MKREFLEKLGLEKDVIDSVMSEHGKSVNAQKAKVEELTETQEDLQNQLTQRDQDIKQLKKDNKDNEELQSKLTALETQYKTDKDEFDQKIAEVQMASALKLALNGKVHDADLTTSLIDKSKIKLDADGNISDGLDDQLKTLKESKAFLFVEEKSAEKKDSVKGFTPPGASSGEGKGDLEGTVGASFAKAANEKSTVQEYNPWG